MPPAVTPTSTHINHNTATTSDDNNILNQLVEDGNYKQGTAIPDTESDCQSKLSLQSSETIAVSEQRCSGVVDEDLLLGLCPEDLLNCSTSFCMSLNDSIGHVKGETFPNEVKTPSVQSPNHLSTSSLVSLHSVSVRSTPKPSTHTCKQSTDNVPAVGLKSSIPLNTFYGLPLKVKQCLEEHRGITKLYGS